MITISTRTRLLGGAAIGLGALMVPQQAMAACTIVGIDIVCSTNTSTTDTQYPGNVPNDRAYVGTGVFDSILTIDPNVLVYGNGLAENINGNLTASNSGTVQVNNGITTVQQGNAAFYLEGANVAYSGPGSALNLGNGSGLQILADGGAGAGAISFLTSGGTFQANNGTAILLNSNNTAGTGATTVDTSANTVIAASNGNGIDATVAGSGTIDILNRAAIVSAAGGPGTLLTGINAVQTGTGGINIVNSGTIGSTADRANQGINASTVDGGLTVINGANIGSTNTAITATSTNGDLNIQSAGTLDSLNGNGITATSTNATVSVTSANITAGGNGVDATSFGKLSVTANGTIQSAGTGIVGNVTGDGAAEIFNTGSITSTGNDGINVRTGGGNITVNSGLISAVAGDGVETLSGAGNQTINITGNVNGGVSDAVHATSTSGTIIVNVTGGNLTGTDDAVQVTSNNTKTVNVSTGRTAGGLGGVYSLGTGATNINNNGTITGTGAAIFSDTSATTVANNTGGVINGVLVTSGFNDTITNSGTINLTGATAFGTGIQMGAGTDTLSNLSGGVLNLTGGLDFGTGTDAFTNASGSTANFTGATSVANLETLSNAGIFNVNNNLTFTGVPTAVTNTGTFNLATARAVTGAGPTINSSAFNAAAGSSYSGGAYTNTATGTMTTAGAFTLTSTGAFTNAGALNLAPALFTATSTSFINSGTIRAVGGNTTITTSAALNNSGRVNLQDSAANDVLTVNGAYVGSNGRLLVDTGDTTSDRLVINGAASGTTSVDITLVGTGRLDSAGVLVVDTTSSSANAFLLGNVTGGTNPLLDYHLQQRTADYYLTNSLNANGFRPLTLTRVAGEMWYQSADEVFAQLDQPTAANANGVDLWGQIYASRDKSGETDTLTVNSVDYSVDNRLRNHRLGVQIGGGAMIGSTARIGLTGGWERNRAEGSSNFTAKGWNIGAYGKFGGPVGFHGYVLAKHDKYKIDFDDALFVGQRVDARSNGIDGNVGYRWGAGGDGSFDINVGLSHVKTKIDDFAIFGFGYDYDSMTSTRGRASARYDFGGSWNPYIALTGYHEFKNDGRVALFDGVNSYDLSSRGKGTWGRLEAGVGGDGAGFSPLFALWGEMGDVKGIGARLGFRFGGQTEAAPPPPPPPPPPSVAPATQTCSDGSVILATDACPPPPPPPPPPAPEPEPVRG